MTEESTTPPDGGDSAPLAGERLAAERQRKGMELHEVARQLHLDEFKVRALEENAFDRLGAPVFAKGYLRKYAELVGLPIEDVLADYYRLNVSPAVPMPIARHREKPPREIDPGPWLAGTVIVVVAAGAAWWWLSSGADGVDESEPSALAPFADETGQQRSIARPVPVTPPTSGDDASPAAGQEPDAGVARTDSESESAQVSAPVLPPDGPGVELRVDFSGDCWTEITDASGERLFFGLGTAGRSVAVTGEPPLQVLLGNSANASLAVDGTSYSIPRTARRGDTARLTISP